MLLPPERYLVTSALPYANGPLHLGHLAGAYIPADVYVRFLRLMGKDVVYVCGSDEHGAAITIKALKEQKTPKEIVDFYHAMFVESFASVGISFDIYHRTSAKIHHETSQGFFRTLYEKGEFIEQESEQYYDEEAGQFLADRYIKGTCPKCGHDAAYGDQCEKCGSSLSPDELINPVSTLTGSQPVKKMTKHWYLALDKYEDWLTEWIQTGELNGEQLHDPAEWKNHVVGQCKSWLEGGLQPRAMTRDLDWGVEVPGDIPGAEGKKLYVWMDAPIGYISATKQWALNAGKDWRPYWQDKDTALIHFIGKDNIVFHCLIFPAIPKAHGDYILPKNVPANQFLNLEGQKLSTSRNWAVWVHEYVKDLPGREDELRYHLIKHMPEHKDSEFTWKGFQESVNNELVNNLANFINRVVVLTHKYYGGKVPEFDPNNDFISGSSTDFDGFHDSELLNLHDDIQDLNQCLRNFDFRGGLKKLMQISSQGNQLLQFNEPWNKIKEDEETVKTVMNLALQIVAALRVVMRPFLPYTSVKMNELLNLTPLEDRGDLDDLLFKLSEGEALLPAGHQIGQSKHLFTRIEDSTIEKQIQKLFAQSASEAPTEKAPFKEEISYDEFSRMDIRVATIRTAERVPKTDKLMKLTLDVGGESRTVISGIAEHFKAENLPGKQVSYLANLSPRKMRGVVSQGMILLAEDGAGQLSFVTPDKKISNGSIIK